MYRIVAALSLLLVSGAQAPATEPRHRTATGVVIVLPDLGGLDCAGMRALLDEIDATGYRGAMPRPDNPADQPLLDYENRLSARYYGHCLKGQVEHRQPSDAFVHGYRP